MESKVCTKCGEWKEYGEFNKDKSKKDGYRYECKSCERVRTNRVYIKRKEANSLVSEDRESTYSSLINIDALKAMVSKAIDYKSKEADGIRQHGGVYFLWGGNELLYVGKGVDIKNRLANHRCTKPWANEIDKLTFIPCKSKDEREMLEGIFIYVLYPKYNFENR